MIDIQSKDFETIKTILKQHIPEYKVVVFGSRAKKTARQQSDLDLCIIGERPLPIRAVAALEEAFSSSDLAIKVDVVDWKRIKPSFQSIIEKDSKIIQDSKRIH